MHIDVTNIEEKNSLASDFCIRSRLRDGHVLPADVDQTKRLTDFPVLAADLDGSRTGIQLPLLAGCVSSNDVMCKDGRTKRSFAARCISTILSRIGSKCNSSSAANQCSASDVVGWLIAR